MIFGFILKRARRSLPSTTWLRLNYWTLALIIFLAALHPLLPANRIFEPAAKVWSAQSIKTFSQDYTLPDKGGYLALPTLEGTSNLDADRVALIGLALFTLVSIFGISFLVRDLRCLFRIRQRSFVIRKINRISIFSNDEITVPFSYWLPGQACVVVPANLLQQLPAYKMALVHELQHHRQRDTKWIHALWLLRLVCIINPFIHLWFREILEVQEFACDETLVDQHKVESQAYARCLVEVAQTAIHQKYVPVCATGLTFLVERNFLKRRIEKMLSKANEKTGRSISFAFGLALVSLMTVSALASKGVVQDRRISMDQALVMAKTDAGTSDFPVVVNDLVLTQLNRYIGTPEGREFMRASLSRMENYRSVVESKLKQYAAPRELMAIPIVESGYQNLPESNTVGWGAGIWMFLASTARSYGLKVDAHVDERLNAELLTDAAMRYLTGTQLRFKDWSLAVLAYNAGETAVQTGIDTTGSRDAWKLIRQGHENDKDYLPRLMATILIMRNPDSVK